MLWYLAGQALLDLALAKLMPCFSLPVLSPPYSDFLYISSRYTAQWLDIWIFLMILFSSTHKRNMHLRSFRNLLDIWVAFIYLLPWFLNSYIGTKMLSKSTLKLFPLGYKSLLWTPHKSLSWILWGPLYLLYLYKSGS